MKKKIHLLVLSLFCVVFAHAEVQYVAPSDGVFRIINMRYGAAMMENFITNTVNCTAVGGVDQSGEATGGATIGGDDEYEQMWVLKKGSNGYSIQNVYTGAYIQPRTDQSKVYETSKTEAFFSIVENKNPNLGAVCYDIWDSNSQGLHCNSSSNVVRWGSNADDGDAASEWRFVSVNISLDKIAEVRAEYAELMTVQDKREGYQAILNQVFVDSACTVLQEAYASKTADALRAELKDQLPAELLDMVVKTKTGEWGEKNEKAEKPSWNSAYAKKFRVQMIEPYSIAGEITEWIGHQAHSNMDNPTGIYANKRGVLYVMVSDTVPTGGELWACWLNGHSKMPNYNNGYSNGVRLNAGLNIIPFGNDGSALYINYLVHTFDNSKKEFGHKLSDFPDLKVHIEGGYINGYYNVAGDELYTPDTDADWMYYEERANLDNITILGRYEVLQFELNDVVDHYDEKSKEYWSHRGLAALFPEELPQSLPENQRINAVVEAWDRIFLAEKLTLGVASRAEAEAANKLYPRWDGSWKNAAEIYNYDDELYKFCNNIKERDGDYGEYYNHHGLAFGTRTGYMYGSWDHSGYHINTTPSILTAIATEAGPTWGPAHEIGHQHQALYTLNGEMEVTNNTFANIAVWYMGMGTSRVNGDQGNLANAYDNFKKGNFLFGNNIWVLTQRYYRLWLYYHRVGHNTQFYPRLFELIRKSPMERSFGNDSEMRPNDKGVLENVGFQLTNGAKSYLHFYKLCCEAAQEDLTEFFRAYGYFVPVDGAFVGDYTNSKYYLTQAQIDAAIAEVKAKNYPVNNKVLFINDCTNKVTYGHDGKTRRSFWDPETGAGKNAEVGNYIDYLSKDGITGEYMYSLANLRTKKITIEGGHGAVGFAIYDKNGVIKAFSNNHVFEINDDVAAMLRKGEVELVAVAPFGEDVAILNKATQGTPEEQLARLEDALKVAKKYIAKSDTTGTKIGFLIPDSVEEYSELITRIEDVVANADTTEYSFGEWYVTLDAANADIEVDATKRVPFSPYCFYSIAVVDEKSSKEHYMEYTTNGLGAAECASEKLPENMHWMFIENGDGTCHIQHRVTGHYIAAAKKNERVVATSTDIEKAGTYVMKLAAPGEFTLQPANNQDLCLLSSSGLSYQVFAGISNAKWAVRLEDDMLALPDTITEEEVPVYYLLRTDNGQYAHYNTFGVFDKGRISSKLYDDAENLQFWFYFLNGSEKGQYVMYNYDQEKPVAIMNDSLLYVGFDATPEYTIALDEAGTSFKLSYEQGCWFMDSLGQRPLAVLSSVTYTPWKLQYIRTISLTNEPLREIVLSKASATIVEGDSLQLDYNTAPKYATNHEVSWKSSNEKVATVSSTGVVKAISVGTAIITATAKDGSGVKAACKVSVNKADAGISNATAGGVSIQNQGGVITIAGLAKGAAVEVYDAAGKLIAAATAVNGIVTVDTGLTVGNTVIVKMQGDIVKTSLK